MALLRMTSRRLVLCLLVVCFFITLLVMRGLHLSYYESSDPRLFQFQPRLVFLGTIPDKNFITINDQNQLDRLMNLSSSYDTKILSSMSMKNELIYRSLKEAGLTPSDGVKIPKIIHQTWATPNIPTSLSRYVESFLVQNPDYEYWFWSDEDALQLVKKRFPQYLNLYQQYTKPIHRADVMRYFVLYEFGGFYADVDIGAVKPLENLRRHSCIISQEPWVHAKVYWGFDHLMPCNAFMAAAPKHPFMKMLVDTIPRNFKGSDKNDVMNKTGPMMLERILKDYERSKEAYTDFDRVYLAEPNLFHPRYDPNLRNKYILGCENPVKYHLSEEEVEECRQARSRRYQWRMPPEAITDHHWVHYWIGGMFVKKINPSSQMHIRNIVPNVRNVSEILLNTKL